MAQGLFTLRQQVQGIVQKAWNTPVGTYAGSFNGSSQYITTPANAAFAFGTGAWTVEAWIYIPTLQDVMIFDTRSSASVSGIGLYINSSGRLYYSGLSNNALTTTAITANTWSHVVWSYDGTTFSGYINGVSGGTATPSFNITQNNCAIGRVAFVASTYMSGYISNLRVVKGTAVYTSNFAPPTVPLAAITGTSLLTLQNATIIDNSTNAFTITNNGSVTTLAAMPFTQLKTPAVDYLVVAGGGGGGGQAGSGGGAGGLLQGSVPVTAGSSITVTVGTGGGGASGQGGTGVNSVFGSISASGGGGGNSYGTGPTAVSGGSGAGGNLTSGDAAGFGGQGVAGQGNRGGTSGTRNGQAVGAGGGGAGTVGLDTIPASGIPGNGGAGISSAISGTVTAYAGGGGGSGTGTAAGGTGGTGGGGAGAACGSGGVNGSAATANTGGGGGGGSFGAGVGGNGDSGIVIVSYPDIYAGAAATTGSPTVSTSGSGSIYTPSTYIAYPNSSAFTLSGDYTIEGWFNVTNLSANPNIFTLGSSTSGTYGILLYWSTGTSSLRVYSGGNAIIIGPTILANVWYHFAIVRSGSGTNNTVLYLNGTSVGSVTNNYSFTGITANGFCVAAEYSSSFSNPSTNYTSNIRITKSALYTGSFTPSTIPLSVVTNTSFLLSATSGAYLIDGSGGASPTLYATSSTIWNQASPFATGLGYKNRVYTYTGSGTITF